MIVFQATEHVAFPQTVLVFLSGVFSPSFLFGFKVRLAMGVELKHNPKSSIGESITLKYFK
jgi:hypothetical protein